MEKSKDGIKENMNEGRAMDNHTNPSSIPLNGKNPKVRSPTELIMDPFEKGGVLRVRVV